MRHSRYRESDKQQVYEVTYTLKKTIYAKAKDEDELNELLNSPLAYGLESYINSVGSDDIDYSYRKFKYDPDKGVKMWVDERSGLYKADLDSMYYNEYDPEKDEVIR